MRRLFLRWLLGAAPPAPTQTPTAQPVPTAAQGYAPSPLVHLYTSVIDILRAQVFDQLASQSTNDLISVGLLAANFALAIGNILLRATVSTVLVAGWYRWWYPLPVFAISSALVAVPLLPPIGERRKFQDGPKVDVFLTAVSGEPLERQLEGLLRSLQFAWARNDSLLFKERKWFNRGIVVMVVAALAGIGSYTWALR
jgi:hypothetical protein